MYEDLNWLHPEPYITEWKIDHSHIDHYNHVNNVAYISRLEALAWEHSNHLGLHFSDYQALDRGMVIQRHNVKYHKPAFEHDTLACATWIAHCDQRLNLVRHFQFICTKHQHTVFTATTHFVCVALSTGMPKRMPESFKNAYGNASIDVDVAHV